jgi:mRNA (guanine-N7-)-methyltransferase
MAPSNPLKTMRKFHNWIKNQLLITITKGKKARILELAGGSGGDLLKWNSNKNIVAVDSYDIVVEEAQKRLAELKPAKPIAFYQKDLSKEILQCNNPYQIISCHFALHYFFENQSTFKTILTSINNCSSSGTVLVMTLFDGENLEKNPPTKHENWYIDILPSKNKTFGRKLDVFLKNTQYFSKPYTEYKVDIQFLKEKLKKCGWNITYEKSFEDWYKGQTKFVLSQEEQDFSFYNTSLVFTKA